MKRREVFATGLLGAIGIGSSRALAQAQANVRFLTPETDPSQVRVWQELISRYAEANRGVTIRPEYASWDDLIRKILEAGGVWHETGKEIVDAFKKQMPTTM